MILAPRPLLRRPRAASRPAALAAASVFLKQVRLRLDLLFLFLGALLLSGCAQFVPQTIELRSAWPDGVPRAVELRDVVFHPQTEYQCGPAALSTVLDAAGRKVSPDDLARDVYLPARRGSLQVEMLAAPRRHGLIGWQIPARMDALLREVAAGNPVLVLQDLGIWPVQQWHYAVVVGFDYEAGELYLRSGTTRREALPFTIFELTWKRGDYWAMVVVPPGRIPATATETGFQQAVAAFDRTASPQASLAAWESFLARWPGNPLASLALGNRYYQARHLALAEAVLAQAAQRHPQAAEVLNNHAQVLSDMGYNAEALAVIDRAAALKSPFAADIAATREGILRQLQRP